MSKLSIKILESDQQIEKLIVKASLDEINKILDSSVNRIISPIRNLIREALKRQPEVASLSGKQLALEFGFPDGLSRIEQIIDVFVNNIIITRKKSKLSGNKVDAGFVINMINSDYKDILALPVSSITTEKGQVLPWLEWLLLFGDKAIINNYDVIFKRSPKSRSGFAVMIKGASRTWSVPPQFAGVQDNNFITRAIESIDQNIIGIMQTAINIKI